MKAVSIFLSCVILGASAQSGLNVIETARRMGIYSYILALEESNSLDLVANTDNITVFMPTNAAFMGLDPAVRTNWSMDPQYYQNVMRYHVVEGRWNKSQLMDEMSYNTYSGPKWTARFVNYDGFSKNVQVYEASVISSFDIEASNGIIHLIDQVVTAVQYQNLMEVIESMPELSDITEAVKKVSNISDTFTETATLGTMRAVTFLAPTNDAVKKLPAGTWDKLLNNTSALTELLQYNVLSQGTWYSRSFVDQQHIPTFNKNGNVTVTFQGNQIFFDKAKPVKVDLAATNGVVHTVDTINFPPALEEMFA